MKTIIIIIMHFLHIFHIEFGLVFFLKCSSIGTYKESEKSKMPFFGSSLIV